MIKVTLHSKKKSTIAGLIVNFLLSWTILPLAVPPFRSYSFRELLILVHMLIGFSFAVIWCQVLNGYDFMIG